MKRGAVIGLLLLLAPLAAAQLQIGKPTLAPIQTKDPKKLGSGKLLVASRDLGDPNFAQTVILLIRYDAQGVVGLVLNRRTDFALSRLLQDYKAAKDRSDPVYLGGPLESPGVFALLQSPTKVEGAEQVFSRVYLISDKSVFEKTISSRPDPKVFHVYMGYAGWTQEQLQMEVRLGGWFVFAPDTDVVFSSDPDSLWSQMIRKTEMKFAGVKRSAPSSETIHNLASLPEFQATSLAQQMTERKRAAWLRPFTNY